MKILVVEDDVLTVGALTATLANQNYTIETASDGEIGWELIESFAYDLVLLDVTLPKLDGISLCQRLRSQGYQMPILLLTAKNSSHDKAIGLDAGADDYVVKPFDPEELAARIRALLRRKQGIGQTVLSWGDLQLIPSSCEVTYADQPLSLTAKEYALLELFLRNSRRVFSCGAILENLWTFEDIPSDEAVRTHIKGLRQKLKAVGAPTDLIETVYGIGYRLKVEQQPVNPRKPEVKSASQKERKSDPLAEITEPTQQQTLALIGKVWHRFKQRVHEQVSILEEAAIALQQQKLKQTLRQQAKQEAHTLAGSLGTFGLSTGSHLARQIEQALQKQALNRDEVTHLQEWVASLRQEIERSPHKTAELHDPAIPFSHAPEENQPFLLMIDRDRALTKTLMTEANHRGFRVEAAANLTRARDKILLESPDVVLFDPAMASDTAESLSLLTELKKQTPPVPVVIFTEQDDLTERLEAARLGGQIFLPKTTPFSHLFEAIQQVLHRANQAKAGVMVVDDDPKLLAIVRSLLEPWGLKVTTLADPQQFWQVLEAQTPDLLILDLEMPEISGIELCQIVRNDSRWSGLPVLFLTAHIDADSVNQVFSVGADDFVSKPIVGPELVTRIINRLERIRFLQHLADIDPLTQTATRSKATQDLDKLLRLAKRHNQPFCLAVLTLHLESGSDRSLSCLADTALQQVGERLRRSFDLEDVVARWEEREFVIGIYGITAQASQQRFSQLQLALRQLNLDQVTITLGSAHYPKDGDELMTLYHTAQPAVN